MHPSSLALPPYYIFLYLQLNKKNRLLPSRSRSQRAQCSSSVFPSQPHSRAALATQARRVPDRGGHPCEVTRRAEACATISNHLRPPDHVGLHVAHRFRSRARCTRTRPTKLDPDVPAIAPALYTTPRAPRRQDLLRRFTPPQILRTLDASPSDQGRIRVSLQCPLWRQRMQRLLPPQAPAICLYCTVRARATCA